MRTLTNVASLTPSPPRARGGQRSRTASVPVLATLLFLAHALAWTSAAHAEAAAGAAGERPGDEGGSIPPPPPPPPPPLPPL